MCAILAASSLFPARAARVHAHLSDLSVRANAAASLRTVAIP
jgi:hypothetical protein